MKKFIKENFKVITAFILGILISGVTVYAINISSADVSYDNSKSGLESTDVEGAINELYPYASKKLAMNTFGNALYSEAGGYRLSNRSNTINLDKGKFILFVGISSVWGTSGIGFTYSDYSVSITCNSECNKHFLGGRGYSGSGSVKSSSLLTSLYFLEIQSDNTIVTSISEGSTSNENGQVLAFQAIPINE